MSVSPPPTPGQSPGMFTLADGRRVGFTFALVCSLFFLWGVCNGMIDVMDKHFQEELHLSLAQSAWVQFAHYLGYFLMALPAGFLATRWGYKGGIVFGLLLVSLGGFWFIPATHIAQFWAFLLGVCVIAAGLTFLETVANPYTTVLGPARYAAARINLAQSCNGVAWIFGPIIGGWFFYGKDASGASTGSQTLWIPYTVIAVVVLVLVLFFWRANLPDVSGAELYEASTDAAHPGPSIRSAWTQPHFIGAVAAQFFYVAAQAGIFSFFINYMTAEPPALPRSWTSSSFSAWFQLTGERVMLSDKGAAFFASVAFGFFLLGRISGAALLRRFAASTVLGLYAAANVLVCVLVMAKLAWLSVAGVFLSYFFMSIMFPTIFALGIHGLGERAKKASGVIVMAIMGGAVLPKLMGWVGDHHGMSAAFVVPAGCFVVVAAYGLLWPTLSHSKSVT